MLKPFDYSRISVADANKKLRHKCDTKPVLADKIDFFDDLLFVESAQLIENNDLLEESGLYGSPGALPV